MLDLYKNIKKLRIEQHLSQEELARRVGYTDRSSIAKIEKGEFDLPQSKIFAFADALGVSASDLMGWDEPTREKAQTVAAHFDGDDLTDEEMDEIQKYIDFVKSRRNK